MDKNTRRILLILVDVLESQHAYNAGVYATTPPGQYPRGEQVAYEYRQTRILDALREAKHLLTTPPNNEVLALVDAADAVLAFSLSQAIQQGGYQAALKTFTLLKRTLRLALRPFAGREEEK